MSTEQSASGAAQEPSGSPDIKSDDKVSYETYRRSISEVKKLREQLRLHEEEKAKSHEEKLKADNQWKALAETYQKQLIEKSKVLEEQEQSIINGLKYQSFEKHLGGKLKKQDYATFIPFEKIVLNPETKQIDDDSVKQVVSGFVKEHSELVEFFGGAKLPNEAARASNMAGKSVNDMSPKELADYILKQAEAGNIK